MRFRYPVVLFLVAAALSPLLWWGATTLPFSRDKKLVIKDDVEQGIVTLHAEDMLRQTFTMPAGRFSSVVIYSTADQLHGERLLIKLATPEGQMVAEGDYAFTRYIDGDLLQIRVPIPWTTFEKSTPLQLTVQLHSGKPLPLRIVGAEGTDRYKPGKLSLNNQPVNGDLLLTLGHRKSLSATAKPGVAGAIVFMLGVAGLQFVSSRKAQWRLAALLLLVVTPLSLYGYWSALPNWGIADWDYYFSLHHYYRETILTYHQFPLWNPYTCGGTAALGDPEFPVLTPTFWLELLFGVERGARLAIYLSVVAGAWGYLALARKLKLSVEAALLVSVAAALGTVNMLELTEGHVNVFAAMWIPWIFWSWLTVYRGERRPLLCGIFLALTFLQGGIYLLMYTLLAFALLILLVRQRRRALVVTLQAGLWALGLAAVKLFPVLLWLRQFPDETYASSAYTLPWIIEILFSRHLHGEYVIYNQTSGWHEYGAYVGYFVGGLAVLGLARLRTSRIVRSLLLAVILAVLVSTAGPALKPYFDYLWFLPRSNISRFILFAVIPLSLLAGFGVDQLRTLRGARMVIVLLLGLCALDILSLSSQVASQAFVLTPVDPPKQQSPYPLAFTTERFDPSGQEGRTTRAYNAAKQGWGIFTYCSVLGPHPLVRTIYDEKNDYIQLNPPEASASIQDWSPNRVRLHVTSPEATTVAINTNYVEGWRVNGKPAENMGGLVGTAIDAGEHNLTLRYTAPGAFFGLVISILTVVVVVYSTVWIVKKRGTTNASQSTRQR